MKFLKNNSYDIVKLFINQIGIAVFSMMLYTSISLIDIKDYKTSLYLAISVLSTAFYFVLIYTASWEFGARDKIRADGGNLEISEFKGSLLSIYANIPNFLLSALALIFVSLYLFGGIEGFNSAFAVINLILRLLMSVYLGIIKGVFSFVKDETMIYFFETAGYVVVPLFAILVTQVGYSLGCREIKIFSLTTGKKNNNKK